MDIWIAIAVYVSYTTIDGLHAIYTIAVVAKSKMKAASISSLMYLLIAAGTISYTDNWLYVFPMAAGGFTGTFVSLWLLSKYEKRKTVDVDPQPE